MISVEIMRFRHKRYHLFLVNALAKRLNLPLMGLIIASQKTTHYINMYPIKAVSSLA